MLESFKNVLLGKPLRSDDGTGDNHLLSKSQALAMLSSDALSSIAYGPEQVILVLTALSASAIWWSLPIGICVLILLISLTISYSQVIHTYPNGGGAYMVSTENLSPKLGLLAGGSLLIDYMLTVAVSVSSGADAITSAFPDLKNINLELSITLVLILMLMNLRGLRESATALFIPVYLFIGAILLLLVFGVINIITGNLAYHAISRVGSPVSGISLFLILRAFTSGSASLTGVEAISNAVPFFKKPKTKNAVETLVIMSFILGVLFIGITFLNYWLGIIPSKDVTILAQIAQAVFGHSALGQAFFYIFQLSTAMILAVAANTGFSAFPVLAYNMAKNKYMPHLYLEKGARLGYSNGIITLAVGAIFLLFLFNGSTEALIPLYTIGVFIPFALAQTGMIIHWKKLSSKCYLKKAAANIIGAIICYGIISILLAFRLGDIWPFFPIIILLMLMFMAIHKHYVQVAKQLHLQEEDQETAVFTGNQVLVLLGNMTQATAQAISYANAIGTQVTALHISTKETQDKDTEIICEFHAKYPNTELVTIDSDYRDIIKPTVDYVRKRSQDAKENNQTLTVLIPQFVPKKSWQKLLHNQMSLRLKYYLRWNEGIVISSYSYHLKD
ncbi:APC family permease [Streptococcus halotolerans]|uniref:APC family permease n=1 Tax=Streptococcus halotolerans TaxID=1814128 RepID=UPI000787449E|nr:APC family permease [Streptococcus halotolerans]